MAKNSVASKKHDLGYYLSLIGNILMWIIILSYFIILPLYLKNGYEMVATNKYKCLMTISKYNAILVGIFLLAYMFLWGVTKEEVKPFHPIWKMDVSMLAFIGIAYLSYFFSSYKHVGEKDDYWFFEGAFYGTSGWFMGLATFLVFAGMYFVISRFFKYDNRIWIPVIVVSSAICLLGVLNRYQVYPIEMELQSASFVATLGNINWFAGYQSVMAPIITGLYFGVKDGKGKRFLAIALFISDMAILLNGSDSAVMSYLVMLYILLTISLKNEGRLFDYSKILVLFSLSGIVIFFIDLCFPEAKDMESNFANIFSKGWTAWAVLFLVFVFWLYLKRVDSKLLKMPKWMNGTLGDILIVLALGAVFVFFILLTLNTALNGRLFGNASGSPFFFDGEWGSSRGATWTTGIFTFNGLPFGKKLIGAGPDCFYFAQKDIEKAYSYAYSYFEGARLTNAHNEIITLLCNIGLLGTAGFISLAVFTIKETLKRVKENPTMICFSLSIIMYLANNTFSFEQVTNTPLYFLVISMAAAAIVAADRKKA